MREIRFPTDAALKKFVQYIVYEKTTQPAGRDFFVFPNPGAAIAYYNEYSFVKTGKNEYTSFSYPGEVSAFLHLNRIDPVRIKAVIETESFTVVFFPIYINYFLNKEAGVYRKDAGDSSFISLPDFNKFANAAFSSPDRNLSFQLIEQDLLAQLRFKPLSPIEEAVELILQTTEPPAITEISKHLATSQRNLSRLFNKWIGLTPVEFRNIVQFRRSLEKRNSLPGKIKMKDIGYESDYSDPSYMIRMYKKFTGLNPSAFFDKATFDDKYVLLLL